MPGVDSTSTRTQNRRDFRNASSKQASRCAQLTETYRADPSGERRYSPQVCTGIKTRILKGDPDPEKISTSYVERQNLTMRMSMRRFTRLTNGFSKKLDNHMAAIAIHFMHYNLARPHKSLSLPQEDGPAIKQTPAMAAGIADHVWTAEEIVELAVASGSLAA